LGQVDVDLDRGDRRHALAEKVGGQAWSWSDFEHIVAEAAAGERPGEMIGLERMGPLGA
jgi:hypothetical protein